MTAPRDDAERMQRVVEAFGHLKEIVAAGDDLPLTVHLELVEHGDERVEDLGDTPADCGRVDHLHALALQTALSSSTRMASSIFSSKTALAAATA